MLLLQSFSDDKEKLLLQGEHLLLRPLCSADVTEKYVSWLNDLEVNQFLESRFTIQTMGSVREYVEKIFQSSQAILFGMFLENGSCHIGNIKCEVNWYHKRGDVGFMIGDKEAWGKGYATEAIRLVVDYLFNTVGLHKITAGAYEQNTGSLKAMKKCGFFEEARLKQQAWCGDRFVDVVLLAILNSNAKK